MLGRRSSSIQMGFPTLCMVYGTGREISKGEWREKAGEIFLKITNIFNVSSKNSGVLVSVLGGLLDSNVWKCNNPLPSPCHVFTNVCMEKLWLNISHFVKWKLVQYSSIQLYGICRIAENKKITRIIHRRYIVPLFEKSTLELNSKINSIEKSIFLSHSLLFHDIPSTLRAFPFFEPPLRTETGALSTGGGNFIFPSLDMPRTARFDQILIPPFRLKAFLPSLSLPLSG